MRVPSPRYSPRQHRQQQNWQGWNQFGMAGVFLSVSRYDWCAPLSHPSSCMLVNHGPSRQSSKEEYKPWKWGAATRCRASHTKKMLPTRKSVPRYGKKTRQTEEEMGRQHQEMDRPGVHQVPEGSGEQRKMKETGCEIIYGAPTTLVVMG